MKKLIPYFLSGLLSLTFILVTGWIAFYSYTSIDALQHFCFYFHLYPFRIGFTGGSSSSIILYYLILWIVISFLMILVVKFIGSLKCKKCVTRSILATLVLVVITLTTIDFVIKKQKGDRISRSLEEDNKNYNSLRTGDIIFHTPINYGSKDNRIAIIDVDIHGYTVLEITDRVQHSSLRAWTQKHKNYIVKRLVNADSIFTKKNIRLFRTERQKFIFKPIDTLYCWTDDEIYDSELIWKTYQRALDIELCKIDTLLFANKNIPEQENCQEVFFVSPNSILESKKLVTIIEK